MHCTRHQQLHSSSAASTTRPFAAPTVKPQQRHRLRPVAAFSDLFKDLFDFNSWAPKSTRIWRLQQYQPPPEAGAAAETGASDGLQGLQARINELRDSGSSSSSSRSSLADPPSSSSNTQEAGRSGDSDMLRAADSPFADDAAGPLDATGSFSDADDSEVSAALSRRIKQIATTTGEWGSSMDEEEMRQPLTGEEIRQLLITKYGKQYDMSFVRRNVPGMPAICSLNIMWLHAEQASFKMTQQQYREKLDGVAELVNVLGQTDKVRAFLKAPARSMKGLPRRPVVGTAISIRLDLDEAQISEWFGRGYD